MTRHLSCEPTRPWFFQSFPPSFRVKWSDSRQCMTQCGRCADAGQPGGGGGGGGGGHGGLKHGYNLPVRTNAACLPEWLVAWQCQSASCPQIEWQNVTPFLHDITNLYPIIL